MVIQIMIFGLSNTHSVKTILPGVNFNLPRLVVCSQVSTLMLDSGVQPHQPHHEGEQPVLDRCRPVFLLLVQCSVH